MTAQQSAELNFWRELYTQIGQERFLEMRRADLHEFFARFPSLSFEQGHGLEIGCGLVSPFEFSREQQNALRINLRIISIDPLAADYKCLFPELLPYFHSTFTGDGEDMQEFRDNSFSYVACINVIDHTPNPEKMIAEISRVLIPGGRLYFEVNCDEFGSPAHYKQWTPEMVYLHFGGVTGGRGFLCVSNHAVRSENILQTRFWVMFISLKGITNVDYKTSDRIG